jgi:hypothetical protein
MEVDVERCPFRPQRQKQEHHMLSDFVAHLILKKIGAREPRQGEIKFLAPKIYLLANTHTLTQTAILQFTLHINVHTHAQEYSRSLRSQIIYRTDFPSSFLEHRDGERFVPRHPPTTAVRTRIHFSSFQNVRRHQV